MAWIIVLSVICKQEVLIIEVLSFFFFFYSNFDIKIGTEYHSMPLSNRACRMTKRERIFNKRVPEALEYRTTMCPSKMTQVRISEISCTEISAGEQSSATLISQMN